MNANRDRIIVYGLGNCWEEKRLLLEKEYEIVACSDADSSKAKCARGHKFIAPGEIKEHEFDYIISCPDNGIIRELICIDYGVPYNKIVLLKELGSDEQGVLEKSNFNVCDKDVRLTIVIPTYNRRERLIRTCRLLEKQTDKNFKVIILDNNSDYNVETALKELSLKLNYSVVRNKFNIGLCGNLASALVQEAEGWVWTLSDDDVPMVNAVGCIKNNIVKYGEAVAFHYSICPELLKDTVQLKTFSDLLEIYDNRMSDFATWERYEGDFVFFSNKVFNADFLKECSSDIFEYCGTVMPHLIPIIKALNEKREQVIFAKEQVVYYDAPEAGKHWDWIETATGVSTIMNYPLELAEAEKKLLYRLMLLSPRALILGTPNNQNGNEAFLIRNLLEKTYSSVLSIEEMDECMKLLN